MVRRIVSVRGIVQGVGFRPHVYRLALRHGLTGCVRNTAAGVTVDVQGIEATLDRFLRELQDEAPPLARILSLSVEECPSEPANSFVIEASDSCESATALVSPDIATCTDCLKELLDPQDRRYLYPFINCTNCGPRVTILRRVPYDRANTSMAAFPMCGDCQREYDDPASRRFHAQPNACRRCGPGLRLTDRNGAAVADDPIAATVESLRAGEIVAIKGIGGFHLAVDAGNATAVAELRHRKRRAEKPFAVMVSSLASAEMLCELTAEDSMLLQSPQRPIVLLPRRTDASLPCEIAPGSPNIGLFLPYTPLHHLLFVRGGFTALVMTSANLSEEPICIDNDEALRRLGEIADRFLLHDRDILQRCDDSVVRGGSASLQVLRRSRGYYPMPVELAGEQPPVLAVGGELKNAVCALKGPDAFLGEHIGDLENLEAYQAFQQSIHRLKDMLQWQPEAIAHDLHPAYFSTQWALEQNQVRTIGVQHHHAHIASCMAEHGLEGPVIGIALDGTGYGTDGTVWGGEVLVADLAGFRRAAHLACVPMPGSAQAIREPWRMAVAYLEEGCCDWSPSLLPGIAELRIEFVRQLARRQIRSPLTSSCGRLFDAVGALVCGRHMASFEAQAAIELEACCDMEAGDEYPLPIQHSNDCLTIETAPLFRQIVDDLAHGVSRFVISGRFHRGLAAAFASVVRSITRETGIRDVCLGGGCFVNAYLQDQLTMRLRDGGLRVFIPVQVPCGDGGLSLGQAVIASRRIGKAAHSAEQCLVCHD
ncbi:MAG TPA: carbamoyltransferase HypF [Acidobacteriaceae bacterium]|nr:carbamoyltransferase HypF [Acidobacteriaceae bacterium]